MKKVLFGILGALLGVLAGYIATMVLGAIFGFIGGIINYDSTVEILAATSTLVGIGIFSWIAMIGGGILGSIFLISKAD